ncbi:hypothetical protein S100390_v1c05320 [Spiroplasma sp. NBRC 100390]|uniref:hypothetical protein n=1 Tax=unclassified Spiroplasma TaxID=2637901 RepID=UPI0008929E4C|nr:MULTISPECIES: hypothetical protein [unclassified Spiroplasma]AOX43871.1 hypothetical protein STU14_v1c05320 [Spiroplasma sp. TU-14]APE13341.1 hypothetical protein S100390_v1c05320 [Spiroplasma sp. NBRC 100390]
MKKILLFLSSGLLATTTASYLIKENIVTKQNNIVINIPPTEKYNDNLASESGEIKWLISTKWMDLTAYTGIKSLAVFKYLYKAIELPNLTVGIGMFTHAKGEHSLQYMTNNWQENWLSNYFNIVEERETIGSAELYAWIGAKVETMTNKKLRHLMLRIHFYGSGNYAATGSRPWGRIFSGDIFNIIWR